MVLSVAFLSKNESYSFKIYIVHSKVWHIHQDDLPDLYLPCQTLLKINNIVGQHAVPGQKHQEKHTQDSFVSQYLIDAEGQVSCFTPFTNLSKYSLLLSPALLICL